jgi:hypothetical protein
MSRRKYRVCNFIAAIPLMFLWIPGRFVTEPRPASARSYTVLPALIVSRFAARLSAGRPLAVFSEPVVLE